MFRVVVDEHILAVRQQVRLNVRRRPNGNLKAAHVSRVAGIFQAILIALEKTLHVVATKNGI